MRYLNRDCCSRDSGTGRIVSGDNKVYKEGGRWVYSGIYNRIYIVEWGVNIGLNLVDLM